MGQVDPQFQNTSENSKNDLLTHFIKGKDCLKMRSFQNSVSRADMHRGLGRKTGWRANQHSYRSGSCALGSFWEEAQPWITRKGG